MTNNIIENLKNTSKINYINYLILFYAFTLSFPGQFKRTIAIILIILFLIDKKVFFNINFKNKLFSLFVLFLSYSFFSFIWTNATMIDSLDYIRRYWYLIPIFIIFKYLTKEYIKLSISFFLAGIFLSEIFSYGNFFGIWEIGNGNITTPNVFMHHVFYSIFLAVTSLILFIKILLENKKIKKVIYILFFITVNINLLINIGRTGQITLILSIFVILLIFYRFKVKYLLIFFTISAVIIILNYNYNSTFKNRISLINSDISDIVINNNYYSSLGGRIGFWIISKEILSENYKYLLFGTGAKQNIKKAHIIVDTKYPQLAYNKELTHFHNFYLSIITQFGIVGISIFLIILYLLFRLDIKDQEIKLIKYSILLVFIFSSLVDMPFYKDSTLSLFAFFTGIFLSQKKYQ